MNIDYEKLSAILNGYAVKQITTLLKYYQEKMKPEVVELFKGYLQTSDIIIINKLDDECSKSFVTNGDYSEENIRKCAPSANGGVRFNDNKIHIYPFKYPNMTMDELLKQYEGIVITHELFHFIIKLYSHTSSDTPEDEFSHYLTEGMVQYETEELLDIKDKRCEYRKNIDLAEEMYGALYEVGQEDSIYSMNYEEINEKYLDMNPFIDKFNKIKEFNKEIRELIEEAANYTQIDVEQIYRQTKRLSINETIVLLRTSIKQFIPEEHQEKLLTRLKEIHIEYNKLNALQK